ncbi:MAG: phage terminase small subunit P27 family [Thermoguttaceae bacterium]
MGKRGTKPKPTALKARAGTLRPGRQRDEPKPAAEIPPFPSWAAKSAAPHWKELAAHLFREGLLTRLDQVALGLLCEALAEYCECRAIVDEAARTDQMGMKYVTCTDKGNIIQHPAVGVMNKAWGKLTKLLVQFGMTPSARAGLSISNAKEEPDLIAQLIAGSLRRN